jgi:23S rRNA (uracil1939-C5)-methyltransferase
MPQSRMDTQTARVGGGWGDMSSTVQITLTDMAHGGDAVGRHEGQVIFVPLALPGETVTVSLEQSRASYARGRVVSVDRASPERVNPPCPFYGRCGGCHWQHIDYPEQLRLKHGIVRTALQRIGGIPEPDVLPMIGMADPWRYRNHVQLRVDARGQVGYYALQSHDIVAADHCLIAHPLLETMWDAHRAARIRAEELVLRAGVNTGERLAQIRGHNSVSGREDLPLPYSCLYTGPSGRRQVLAGRDYYTEKVLERPLRVSADSFFQNNTTQTERLIQVAAAYLQLKDGESLLDAYCGGGLLGLALTNVSDALYGIESYGASVRDARANAGGRGAFLEGDVAKVAKSQGIQVDAVILDPPRTGCTPETVEALASCGASRIVYVSCDPATLARDVARFSAKGYAMVQAQPIDMFPQTYHVEVVALMSRNET